MLLEYSSTFELCILSIRTKKTEKKENVVAQEIATGKTMTLFGALISKIMMGIFALRELPQLSAVNYCRKELHPRCLEGSQIPL